MLEKKAVWSSVLKSVPWEGGCVKYHCVEHSMGMRGEEQERKRKGETGQDIVVRKM